MKNFATHTSIIAISLCFSLTACNHGSTSIRVNGLTSLQNCAEAASLVQNSLKPNVTFLYEPEAQASIDPQDTADQDLDESDRSILYKDMILTLGESSHISVVKIAENGSLNKIAILRPEEMLLNPSQIFMLNDRLIVYGNSLSSMNSENQSNDGGFGTQQTTYGILAYDIDSNPESPTLLDKIGVSAPVVRSIISQDDRSALIITQEYFFASMSAQDIQLKLQGKKVSLDGDESDLSSCRNTKGLLSPYHSSPSMQRYSLQRLNFANDRLSINEELGLIGDQPIARFTAEAVVFALPLRKEHILSDDLNSSISLSSGLTRSMIIRMTDLEGKLSNLQTGFIQGHIQEVSNMRSKGRFVHLFTVIRELPTGSSEGEFAIDPSLPELMNEAPKDSKLVALEGAGDKLLQVAELESLGPNEHLFATRFTGERAYAVSSKVLPEAPAACGIPPGWDPYSIISLDKPESPTILGQLEIGGYTRQLIPTASGSILGLGRDEDGKIQANLFSATTSELVDQLLLGDAFAGSSVVGTGSWNIGDDGFKSYMFDEESQLLAMPLSVSATGSCSEQLRDQVKFVRLIDEDLVDAGNLEGFDSPVLRILSFGEFVLSLSNSEIISVSKDSPTEAISIISIED
ncbi:MAG: hypothetical protein COV44_01320 [Deltaproteobacteria bacterium CG11_big_fil_rev_8_21_14_0_20_45_16]|nr:MAG: hypothetical protein COV44_01320 [Deltaproteobacteria bacterium CG11_big_fil_rev_8_21_14_0_20_45_16]